MVVVIMRLNLRCLLEVIGGRLSPQVMVFFSKMGLNGMKLSHGGYVRKGYVRSLPISLSLSLSFLTATRLAAPSIMYSAIMHCPTTAPREEASYGLIEKEAKIDLFSF